MRSILFLHKSRKLPLSSFVKAQVKVLSTSKTPPDPHSYTSQVNYINRHDGKREFFYCATRNTDGEADETQGAKAASKRDRKDKDTKVAKSQLKVNEKAMDIQCNVCKSTFLKTTRAPAYVPSSLA